MKIDNQSEQEETNQVEKHHHQEEEENLKRVEDIRKLTGYKFRDPKSLQQAFTHHSYEEGCPSFERFEFIGDAFLQLMIGQELYSSYPDFDPGKLTRLRAVNVDTEKLARAALKHNLHKFLRHNIPLLDTQIERFRDAIMEYPLHSSGLIVAPKVLADITESLIGAVYSDYNFCTDATWKVAKNLLEPIITPETLPVHPVTLLHEMCDKKKLTLMSRDSWERTGEFEFVVDKKFSGKAKFSDKKAIAKNRAAFLVYNQILEKLTDANEQ
ncbi:hypothetical protein ACS0TY_017602 [Phlomoides rotata]